MYEDVVHQMKSPNLSEVVRDELIRLITQGALKPGARLNEVHLAKQLGVSRGPLREAARELEGLGLITSRPRKGFCVADFTEAEIVDLYEVSLWVHQALANDFMTYSNVEICRMILLDVDSIKTGSVPEYSETLLQVRERIVKHVHNRYLAEHVLSLYRRFYIVGALVRADDKPGRMRRVIETQRSFWAALAERDQAKAVEIIQADSRYWLRDIPPRFSRVDGPRQGRE
ncbi:GntR family transcriptional regulator [Mesorhizobium sp. M1050]|uniref:GntR family transcriptional regulator n=1 Tax=Mesorhizobium sp. M1050 TaxID=2957051 RepID=UPI003337AA7E